MNEQFKERAEVLGGLIRDARLHASRSLSDCAQILQISSEDFEAIESGDYPVSLPDLEALSLFLKVPMGYFWGRDPLDSLGQLDYNSLITIRNRIIGASLRQYRLKGRKSTRDLGASIGETAQTIEDYEAGRIPIPYLHLEHLSKFLELSINEFVEDSKGPLRRHEDEQKLRKLFHRMDENMQAFLLNPVNSSYLDTAKMLSEMDVDKLRLVAESILDITF